MTMMIYRVILKVGYYERWFDFEDVRTAGAFAENILRHQVVNDDHEEEQLDVVLRIINRKDAKEAKGEQ